MYEGETHLITTKILNTKKYIQIYLYGNILDSYNITFSILCLLCKISKVRTVYSIRIDKYIGNYHLIYHKLQMQSKN